ncbi:DUF6367 family protein [Erwinia sp. BNK-24-b]|uniref:DUF6367 family protein n=1 Tax=unclassified Erwinia TaxID=2622719 RepID=UPI0039BF3201
MKNENKEDDILIIISLPVDYPHAMEALTKYDAQSGFSYRVDPENEGARTKRHIHIWKGKKKAKGVAWNIDGKRHDKKSFNTKLDGFEQAKELAARILKPTSGTLFNLSEQNKFNRNVIKVAKVLFSISGKDVMGRIIYINYE